MKLKGAKGVDSTRVRRTEEQTAQIESSEKLTSAESTLYRSLVMKLAYVAQDRVDIAEAVKCLTRHMKEQRSGHMQELKRLGRYLVKNRRCVQRMHDKRQMQRCRCMWTLIGLEICLEGRARNKTWDITLTISESYLQRLFITWSSARSSHSQTRVSDQHRCHDLLRLLSVGGCSDRGRQNEQLVSEWRKKLKASCP